MKSRKKKRLLCGLLCMNGAVEREGIVFMNAKIIKKFSGIFLCAIIICATIVPVMRVSAEAKVDSINFVYPEIYRYELRLESGSSYTLETSITTRDGYTHENHIANNSEVKYTSSNPYVIRVNNDGTITALSVGTAKITATSTADKTVSATSVTYFRVVDNKRNFNEQRSWPISYQGNTFTKESNGAVRCYDSKRKPVVNQFVCDGVYTYYFQLDGTAMQDRLTYHPDGAHIIYFDEWGHEVFSDFAHVKRAIAGNAVDDYCFFNVYGYMYVNVLTYDKNGRELYYANAYGVLERDKWFQFDPAVMWADGTPAYGVGGQFGKANSDGTLVTNRHTSDWQGRRCYLQGNGVAAY